MGRQLGQTWRWPDALWRGALAVTATLALGLTWAIWAAPARAAGGCGTTQSCIHWSSDMIYAGQNNGFPEGPVGEHVVVNGEGFQVYAGNHLSLSLVKGDVNTAPDAEFCKFATPRVNGVAASIPVDSSGNMSASFDWPAAAGSGDWSVCAIGPDGLPTFNVDDGPFHVMSSHAPSLTLSNATVNPGGSVIVTGHNWLPAQDQIFVYAGPCADCDGTPLATDTVSSSGGGAFTATLKFAVSAAPGTYIVSAHNQSGVLDTMMSGPHITVALAPTATPAPTATAIPTATSASGGSSSNGGSSGGSSGLSGAGLLLLGVGGLLALALLGAGIFFLARRRPPTVPPGGPHSGPGAPPYPPYMPAGPDDVTIPIQPPVDRRG